MTGVIRFCLIRRIMRPVILSILSIGLSFEATAQEDIPDNNHCNEHKHFACSISTCAFLKTRISNCCEYRNTYSRFVDGKQYILLNPCENIKLYKHEVRANKWVSYSYFFSRDIDSPILKLTRENLQLAYPDDPEFQKKLDELFSKDSQLTRFDGLYNMYAVNWLYVRVKHNDIFH